MDNPLSSQSAERDKVSQAKSDAISSVVSTKMNDYKNIRDEITKWCDVQQYSLIDSVQHELAILIIQDQDSSIRWTTKELLKEPEDNSGDWLTSL